MLPSIWVYFPFTYTLFLNHSILVIQLNCNKKKWLWLSWRTLHGMNRLGLGWFALLWAHQYWGVIHFRFTACWEMELCGLRIWKGFISSILSAIEWAAKWSSSSYKNNACPTEIGQSCFNTNSKRTFQHRHQREHICAVWQIDRWIVTYGSQAYTGPLSMDWRKSHFSSYYSLGPRSCYHEIGSTLALPHQMF